MESIGDRIRRLREADKKSQDDIVDALANFGIKTNRSAISKWESGTNVPVLSTAMALAKIFGVTSDYLIEGINGNGISIKPNEKAIVEAIRENPHLAQVLDCARNFTPEQIKLACRIVHSIVNNDQESPPPRKEGIA